MGIQPTVTISLPLLWWVRSCLCPQTIPPHPPQKKKKKNLTYVFIGLSISRKLGTNSTQRSGSPDVSMYDEYTYSHIAHFVILYFKCISVCAVCCGFEYRNQPLQKFGISLHTYHLSKMLQSRTLMHWERSVYLYAQIILVIYVVYECKLKLKYI